MNRNDMFKVGKPPKNSLDFAIFHHFKFRGWIVEYMLLYVRSDKGFTGNNVGNNPKAVHVSGNVDVADENGRSFQSLAFRP
jgi:hypothetical protein